MDHAGRSPIPDWTMLEQGDYYSLFIQWWCELEYCLQIWAPQLQIQSYWEISEISPKYEMRFKSTTSRGKFGGTEFVYSRKERFKKKVSGIFDVWGIVTRIRTLNIPDEKESENKSVLSAKAEVVTTKPQKYNDVRVTPAARGGQKYLLYWRV